jgi:hypothetical protein
LQDLDAVVAQRCNTLDPQVIQSAANFHWWPTSIPAS